MITSITAPRAQRTSTTENSRGVSRACAGPVRRRYSAALSSRAQSGKEETVQMAEGDSGRRGRSVAFAIITGVALVLLAVWMFSFEIDFNPFWTHVR